jgi:hypothetical protein
MARLRARTYAYLIGIGTPILLAGVLWWFRRQGGPAAPSDQLFALVIGAAMLGTVGILLRRSLPTLAASLALLVLGFPQEVLGSVILPSGGLYLIAAFIVGLTDIGEMVGEGIEAGKEGMEESGMNAPEMPSAFQDATDGGETEPKPADTPQSAGPEAETPDLPEQPVPDAEAPDGPEQPVDADDVDPITAEDGVDVADSPATDDAGDETPDPEEVVEEHGPHHAPEVQVDQDRVHADDPSVGRIGGDGEDATEGGDTGEIDGDEADTGETDGSAADADERDESATDGESREPTGNRGTRAERPGPDEARDWGGDSDGSSSSETNESADAESDADAGGTDETTTDDATAPTGAPDEPPEGVEKPDDPAEVDGPEMEEHPDPDSATASKTLPPDEPGAEDTGPVESDPVQTDETDDHGHPDPVRSVEPAGEDADGDTDEDAENEEEEDAEAGDDETAEGADTETSRDRSS